MSNDIQVMSQPESAPKISVPQTTVNIPGSTVVKNLSRSVLFKKEGSMLTSHGSTQLPVRIVHSVASSGTNNQVRKIIQVVKPEKGNSSNVIHIRSPMKTGKKLIGIPGTKILANPNTKLKVGETIKIQKATSVHHPSYNHPSVCSTPTKVISSSIAESSSSSSAAHFVPTSSVSFSSPSCFSSGPSMVVQSSFSSPIRPKATSSWASSPARNKRPATLDQCQAIESKRRRTPTHGDKGGKGLRHFAMLVCEKVKQKVTTTYNEVADELVADYAERQKYQHPDQVNSQYDQKNIRRRVYDALNVLMAMNIIYKDKKDIHWVGLPTNSAQEVQALQSEKTRKEQRIQQKTSQLQELILQQIAFKNLVQRNKRLQETQGPPQENSSIQLPFIIVNTSKKTVIDCSISNDKYEYLFNFNNTFEIHDDIEVLKRMGMAFGLDSGNCSSDNLKHALTLVPPALKPYLEQMAGVPPSFPNSTPSSSSLQKSSEQPPCLNISSFSGLSQIVPKEEVQSPSSSKPSVPTTNMFRTIKPDPDDQEVAMVTTQLNNAASCNSNNGGGGGGGGGGGMGSGGSSGFISCSSSSHTSSSRPHSAGMMSITPLSSSRSSADVGFDDDDDDLNSCGGDVTASSMVADSGFVS